MIFSYGLSLQGFNHIRSDTVCQDSHRIEHIKTNVVVVAVADGVGSEIHSDMASRVAASKSVEYCKENFPSKLNHETIQVLMKKAFIVAKNAVMDCAKESEFQLNECNTTLTLAIIIGSDLYFGHVGDGGIIVLNLDGTYSSVTTPQNDEEGRVYTLFFEDSWVFDKYHERVAGTLLATDGIYNWFYPPQLGNTSTELANLHIFLVDYFLNKNRLNIKKNGEKEVRDWVEKTLSDPKVCNVYDDKTIVIVINDSISYRLQPKEYYAPLDWDKLNKDYDERVRAILDDLDSVGTQKLDVRYSDSRPVEDHVEVDGFTFTECVGRGGEGTIYRISDTLAAKIFRDEILSIRGDELLKKVELMRKIKLDPTTLQHISWPIDLLYKNGSFCGYTMPSFSGQKTLRELYDGCCTVSHQDVLKITQNICKVVESIHSAGLVFGDLSPNNIGYNDRHEVFFYGMDACHIVNKTRGYNFRCRVGNIHYIAPEIFHQLDKMGSNNPAKVARYEDMDDGFSKNTDNFALAVIIFQNLTGGYSPFDVKPKESKFHKLKLVDTNNSPDIVENIKNNVSVFSRGYVHITNEVSKKTENFSNGLKCIFRKSFEESKSTLRPNATDWINELKQSE